MTKQRWFYLQKRRYMYLVIFLPWPHTTHVIETFPQFFIIHRLPIFQYISRWFENIPRKMAGLENVFSFENNPFSCICNVFEHPSSKTDLMGIIPQVFPSWIITEVLVLYGWDSWAWHGCRRTGTVSLSFFACFLSASSPLPHPITHITQISKEECKLPKA